MRLRPMNASSIVAGLCVFFIFPVIALADDNTLQQLRNEGGTTQATYNTAELHSESANGAAPSWMVSQNNPPEFSSKSSGQPMRLYGQGGANQASDIGFEAVLAWNSEHIFRGVQEAKQTIAGGVEISYDQLYGGVWAVVPTADSFNAYQNRIDLYAGYGFDISDVLQADIGVTGYIRPDNGALFAYDDSVELYAGISTGGQFNPALYGFYDFVLDRFVIEASTEYILPFARTDLVVGGTLGYQHDNGFDFGYAQLDIELVQNFTQNTSIGIGGHFAASTDNTFLRGLAVNGKNTTWFGIRLRAAQ